VAITCDGAFLNGKVVELKKIMDEALKRSPTIEHLIVYKRTGQDVPMEPGRDYWYHDLMNLPIARNAGGGNRCETEEMDAEDPLSPVYVWHHRQAEGDSAHTWWLHGRCGDHAKDSL